MQDIIDLLLDSSKRRRATEDVLTADYCNTERSCIPLRLKFSSFNVSCEDIEFKIIFGMMIEMIRCQLNFISTTLLRVQPNVNNVKK